MIGSLTGADPMQQQQQQSLTANRGSPAFPPPHRTSTPDNHHNHRRTPSYHNSPQVARGSLLPPEHASILDPHSKTPVPGHAKP